MAKPDSTALGLSGDKHLGRVAALRELRDLATSMSPVDDAQVISEFLTTELRGISPEKRAKFSKGIDEILRMFGAALDGESDSAQVELDDPEFGHILVGALEILTLRLRTPESAAVLRRSLLTMAVSDFEILLGVVAKFVLRSHPDKLNPGDATLTLAQLQNIGDIRQAIEIVVDRRVEDLLRGDLIEWEKWFGQIGVKFRSMTDSWPALAEIFARRNLLVHNDGYVNLQYLNKIDSTTSKPIVGTQLEVTSEYLSEAVERLTAFALLMVSGTWLQTVSDEDEKSISWLVQRTERLCETGENLATRIICDTVLANHRGRLPRSRELRLTVLRWIARRNMGEIEKVEAEVRAWDASALDDSYLLSRSVLTNDEEMAIERIRGMLKSRSLTRYELLHDPLYAIMRGSAAFERMISESDPDNYSSGSSTTVSVKITVTDDGQ